MKKTLTAAGLTGLVLLGMAAPAAATPFSDMNHEWYWESDGIDCTKVELDGYGKTFTLEPLADGMQYIFLVLKAGSGSSAHQVIDYPEAGVAYGHQTTKGLSWAMSCVGEGYES